jgi:hypothetical protein
MGGSAEKAVDCPDCGGDGTLPPLGEGMSNPYWVDDDGHEHVGMSLRFRQTQRGFRLFEFKDRSGHGCSLQESSLATEAAIWLGPDDSWPTLFYPKGVKHPDHGGWEKMDRTLPEGVEHVLCDGRMQLTVDQLRVLVPVLQRFIDEEVLPDEAGVLAGVLDEQDPDDE